MNDKLRKPNATKEIVGKRIASSEAIVRTLDNSRVDVSATYDSLTKDGGCTLLKLKLKNNNAVDVNVPFGTLMGLDSSASAKVVFPSIAGAVDFAYDAVINPLMDDNYGAGLTMLKDLNLVWLSKPVIVSGFEVITANTALGLDQRSEPLTLIDYPTQFEDSKSKKGTFVAQFTEITSAQVLDKPIVFGTFKGAIYKVKAGAEVFINIYIGAQDVNNFACAE